MRFVLLFALVVSCCTVGCGGGETPAPGPNDTSTTNNDSAATSRPSHPAGQAADKFMAAVVEGNIETATNLLTPRAIEQFAAQGKRFAPPGLGTATYRIGQVETPTPDQALVQCILIDKNATEGTAQEEICCMMRQVNGQWRVSGIAYDTGTSPEPVILSFEELPPMNPSQGQQVGADGAPATRAAMQPQQQPLQ